MISSRRQRSEKCEIVLRQQQTTLSIAWRKSSTGLQGFRSKRGLTAMFLTVATATTLTAANPLEASISTSTMPPFLSVTMATPQSDNLTAFSEDSNRTALMDSGDMEIITEFEKPQGPNTLENLITTILFSIVCIVGLFGNTLVIYVVMRFSKMQTVTNTYILNLAIADECYLIGIPFLLYTMQVKSWQFGEFICKAYMVSTSITQFTSSIFLLIMAADRYIAVCHPISSSRYRTPFVSKIVSAVAWLLSVLMMLPVMLFANAIPNGDHTSCNIQWPETLNVQSDHMFILYTLLLGFATPLTFISGFYFLVVHKLHIVGLKHKSKDKKRSHRKVTKLVLTVIAVYICCWLPYWIDQLILIYSKPEKGPTRLEILMFLLVSCLAYSNSAMNPLLYAFLSDNFKKSFLKAFSCLSRESKPGVSATGTEQTPVERSILSRWNSTAKRRSSSDTSDTADTLKLRKNTGKKRCRSNFKRNVANFLHPAVTSTAGVTNATNTSIIEEVNSDMRGNDDCIVELTSSAIPNSNKNAKISSCTARPPKNELNENYANGSSLAVTSSVSCLNPHINNEVQDLESRFDGYGNSMNTGDNFRALPAVLQTDL